MKNKQIIFVNANLQSFGHNEKKKQKHVDKMCKSILETLKEKGPSILVVDEAWIRNVYTLNVKVK